MTEPAYRVEPGVAASDAERVLAVWRGNLGRPERLAAKYDRFYRRCPFGEPLLRLLRHTGTDAIVGVAAAGPRRMHLGDRTLEAGVLVDLAVLPEHRSLFPALALQKGVMADGLARYDLLYGFPNPKAAAVFKRAGYAELGRIVRYAAVVRSAHYLARHLPGPLAGLAGPVVDAARAAWQRVRGLAGTRLAGTWSDRADARMDALWARTARTDALAVERTAGFLNWQFEGEGEARYRFFCLARPGSPDLVAWFACRSDGAALLVSDFWSDEGCEGLHPGHLGALLREARRTGHAAVYLEFLGSPAIVASLVAAGFVPRGSRPVYHLLSPALVAAGGISKWHLTSADEDE